MSSNPDGRQWSRSERVEYSIINVKYYGLFFELNAIVIQYELNISQ